jgi:hypothetical protein
MAVSGQRLGEAEQVLDDSNRRPAVKPVPIAVSKAEGVATEKQESDHVAKLLSFATAVTAPTAD